MNDKLSSVLTRFLKGAVAGGISAMAVVSYVAPMAWSDFPSILNTLGIAFCGGAIAGLLLSLQKWASWKE